MAFLRGGTGNDFAKNLPAPAHDYAAMAGLIARGCDEWRVDLGRVDGGGAPRWFLNVAGFGFDVAVLIDTQRKTWMRGNAVYITAALKHLVRYGGFDVQADVLGDTAPRRRMMLVISNGLNFGGAFRIAPTARVDDGLLDFIAIGDFHRLLRIPLFASALRGAHLRHRKVAAVRAAGAILRFAAPPSFELDGELHHATTSTLTIRTVPGALRVLVG
jgi:diacylglycerol kinase (ATP)